MKKMLAVVSAFSLLFCAASVMAKTKYVTAENLDATMESFNAALGVKCDYCHVADKSATIKDYKWANDQEFGSLRHKRVAQAMLGMQIDVNKESSVQFDCMKCHQGKKP